MKTLVVGSVAIPAQAALDLDQKYENLGPEGILRMGTGRGVKQATWRKTKILTSGAGWIPPGLEGLDFNAQLTLKCIIPQHLTLPANTLVAALPAKRRSDAGHLPFAIALLPGGQIRRTAVALAGDVATVTAVAGAQAYSVGWYPQFNVWALSPSREGSRGSATHRWELVCEEV